MVLGGLSRLLGQDLGADLVDEAHGLRQRKTLADVGVVLLPPLHAELDVRLLRLRVPALLVAVQDHRYHKVHHQVQADDDVAEPIDYGQDVLAEEALHASVGLLREALRPQDVVAHLRVEEVRGRAPVPEAVVGPLVLGKVMHQLVPGLSRRRPEERDEGLPEVVEVAVHPERAISWLLGGGEEANAQDPIECEDQQQDGHDVPELWQRKNERHEDLVHLLEGPHDAEEPRDPEDAHDTRHSHNVHGGEDTDGHADDAREDAEEVEEVPVVLEVVPVQREDLQASLYEEDAEEEVVQAGEEGRIPRRRRREYLEAHEQRVEQDGRHDAPVEVSVHDQVVRPSSQLRQGVQVRQLKESLLPVQVNL
mmetsp:Transcript_45447/g.122341  ORF Transcript_45447/g.122341 Transcript_45447/m.122341 type:complete len:365 (-) Transcript_45447:251-1345(-)